MKEIQGDLWAGEPDLRVITTNGTFDKHGSCVMGRGCALEARQRFPEIAQTLGRLIKIGGNHVYLVMPGLASFPVKHNWWEDADPKLIERSAKELVALAGRVRAESIVMPRPGCGNGRLRWESVKKILSPILDDRFVVVSYPTRRTSTAHTQRS